MSGARAVVECLKAEGVEFVFGVPGGQTLSIMDVLYETPEIRFITTRDERGAAHMADAYGRITGTPGICLATTGPGATNLITGIGGAMRDSSPVIAITVNNRRKDIGYDDAQDADHVALFQSLTKWSVLVTAPERIPHVMREAFRRALAAVVRRLPPSWRALETTVREWDHAVAAFYRQSPRGVLASFGFHFLGWLAGVGEVFIILRLLRIPVSLATAWSVEALWLLLKSCAFLIPASLGASEGFLLLVCAGLGVNAVSALALGLVRRARELVWVGLGLAEFARGRAS